MKATKKLIAVVLAVVLTLALGTAAFADGATITVNNATTGKSYQLYKVFDATFATVGETESAAYTTPSDIDANFLAALKKEASPFALTENTSGVYNVELKEGKAIEDVISFLTTNKSYLKAVGSAKTASGDSVVWTGVADGYYYVTSTLGSAVTITNAKSVTIQDKNQKPGPSPVDPDDPSSATSYKVIVDADGNELSTGADMGETVTFRLQAKATNYDGDKQITKYVASDNPSSNLGSFAVTGVTVGGAALASDAYTVDTTSTPKTVTIPWVNETTGKSLYAANADIVITCTATVTGSGANTNEGWFDWYDKDNTKLSPETPEKGTTTVYTGTVSVFKYTGTDTPLSGAKFVLKNSDGKFYKNTSDVISWVTAQADATVYGSDGDGKLAFDGVKPGTYSLVETEAPKGYNPLTAPVTVAVSETELTPAEDVKNEAGAILPETGGFGTTMLLTLGSVLFVAAGILLVTKKRMYNQG